MNDGSGLRARGGFEVGLRWSGGALAEGKILSILGNTCRIRSGAALKVSMQGKPVHVAAPEAGVIEFRTAPGATYVVAAT